MTAEDLIKTESNFFIDDYEEISNLMIKFAKYHVKKALVEQANLAKRCIINKAPVPSIEFLNSSYPLKNIV